MKQWLLFLAVSTLLLSPQFSFANSCHEYYGVEAKTSFNLFQAIATIQSKFADFITENRAQDFTQACQAGVQTCMSTLSKGVRSSADLLVIQGKALPLALGKALLSPIDTVSFSIEPSKVKKQVVTPLADILKKGKDAAANLERIEKGLLDPQDIYKAQLKESRFGGLRGMMSKKSNKEITDELRKKVEELEVDIWTQGYYSFGMIGIFGVPKLPATVSLDMVTGMITQQEGSGSKMAQEIAKKIIFERMKNSFKENKHLPMLDRTRTALQDSINFTNAKEDVLAAKQVVFEEFGFNELLAQINRDPFAEVLAEQEPKALLLAPEEPVGQTLKRGLKFWK